jgi:hypothetical protein
VNTIFPHPSRTTFVDLSSADLEALAFTTPDSHGEWDACHNEPPGYSPTRRRPVNSNTAARASSISPGSAFMPNGGKGVPRDALSKVSTGEV